MRKNTKQIIIILIFLIFFVEAGYADEIKFVPTLTSENFDNRATKIILKLKEEKREIGSGFFITDGRKFIYLVSAGHVFKEALKSLLVDKGTLVVFQKFEDKDATVKNIYSYDIDLIKEWQEGLLKFNEDPSIDVGILKLREFIEVEKEEDLKEKEIQPPKLISSSIDLFNDEGIVKYDDLKKAENVIFFGYPVLPTLKQVDKTHYLDPLIRKGIISKKVDGKKIIIDGFVSSGSSGSPVFVRSESIPGRKQFIIKLSFIGLITQYFPYHTQKIYPNQEGSELLIRRDEENAGLALVESVDNILDTLMEFQKETNKEEIKKESERFD